MSASQGYWPLILKDLKTQVNSTVYKTWFSEIKLAEVENLGRKIVVEVPSEFNKKYIQNKYTSLLKTCINKFYPRVIHLDFRISKNSKKIQDSSRQEDIFAIQENLKGIKKEINDRNNTLDLNGSKNFYKKNINNLNPKYTFNNFVTIASNQLAVSVSEAIIQKPGKLYNPVFIYSGVGLGKTHLLQAIGQKMLSEKPDFKIKYATCETFFNFFISSIQNKKSEEFKEYFRNIDLLLLDDIQFISGKEGTQEAFFHTFNELHQQNKQIVITSDKPPKSLNNITERLISRFEWGIVIDISKPDLEDRITVIKDKVDRIKLDLSIYQVARIAEAVNTNFRDLEGVLNRIQARKQLLPDKPFEDSELTKILDGYESASMMTIDISYIQNSPQKILNSVAQVYSLSRDQILSKSRQKDIAEARQVAMFLLKEQLELSYPAVAKVFSRDHSTVIHAHKKITTNLSKDQKLTQKIEFIKQLVTTTKQTT